jgi:NADH-quinone oxidoreductase subunit C
MSEENKEKPEAAEPEAKEAKEKPTPDAEAKEKAAAARAEARAARAKAKEEETKEEAPKEPSPNQPFLDRLVQLIKSEVSEQAVEEASINEKNSDLPTLVIKNEHWHKTAKLLRDHTDTQMNYLRNLSGVDYETHLETVYHMLSMVYRHECAIKVRTDRENPSIASVTDVWATADWNEREVFDLLGIDFPGHPNMVRIMMSDDWVGHPLRKDYEQFDEEV